MANWDWRMKLKINKNYIKESGTKSKNQNNKEWNWNYNNKEGQAVIFKVGQREKKVYEQQTGISLPTLVPPLKRKRNDTSNNTKKNIFFLLYKKILYTPLREHGQFPHAREYMHFYLLYIYLIEYQISS
jgi:hypothetical protein